MKSNFYTTDTRAKYYAIRSWIRCTITLSIILFATMGMLYLPEYLLHRQLSTQHAELHSLAFKNATPQNTTALQLAFTKIESRQKKATRSVALLQKIKSICKDDSSLESLSFKRHDVQITLAAKNAPTLISIADSLAHQPSCHGLHISSLEPKEQRMIAILKSTHEMKNS